MEIISRADAKAAGLKTFYTGTPCKHEHDAERYVANKACLICSISHRAKWNNANKARISEYGKLYGLANKEKINNRKSKWRKENLEIIKLQRKNQYQKNGSKNDYHKYPKIKQRRNERYKERMRTDEVFALSRRISTAIGHSLRRIGQSKTSRTEKILGCSFKEFSEHIERQFVKGMNWQNRNKWHIDHIIPLATAKTKDDIIALNHFTNLRPMWAKDNILKGANTDFLL